MKIVYRILGRFYFKRAGRSLRLHRAFQKKSEKFFSRIKGAQE